MLLAVIYGAVALLGFRFTVRAAMSDKPVGGRYLGPDNGKELAAVFGFALFLVALWPLWYAFLAVYGLGTQNWEKILAGTPKSVKEERRLAQEKMRKQEYIALLEANALKSHELGVTTHEEYQAELSSIRRMKLEELEIHV